MLYRICTNPSKQEFDILYEDLMENDDAIRAWLKIEPKKSTLSYDFGGCCYDNTTTNLSKIFNNVLRTIHDSHVSAIVQIIFLGVINNL